MKDREPRRYERLRLRDYIVPPTIPTSGKVMLGLIDSASIIASIYALNALTHLTQQNRIAEIAACTIPFTLVLGTAIRVQELRRMRGI